MSAVVVLFRIKSSLQISNVSDPSSEGILFESDRQLANIYSFPQVLYTIV
jgi:hypothetical protein